MSRVPIVDPPWARAPLRVDPDLRKVFENAVSTVSQEMPEGKARDSLVRRLEDWAVSMSQLADEHFQIISIIQKHVVFLGYNARYCFMLG